MKRLSTVVAALLAAILCTPAMAMTETAGDGALCRGAGRDKSREDRGDAPAARSDALRSDTLSFGFYDQTTGYAVLGGAWTWDHGSADPLEGWTSVDDTESYATHFRRISASNWAGHDNVPPVPLISGEGSAWLGVFEDEADDLCWGSGLGYGSMWCQRLVSPSLNYGGSGGITLQLKYFSDSEHLFDYTKIFLDKNATSILLNESGPGVDDGFSGQINIDCTPLPCVPSIPAQPWQQSVTAAQMGQAGSFTIRIQFESDNGWSDEDGEFDSALGPIGIDDIAISGGASASYQFEIDLEGWTPGVCSAVGSFFAVHPIAIYSIPDPCGCSLRGNVVGFHDGAQRHPLGQKEAVSSNVVDRTGYLAYNAIFADWDMFADMPRANGVFYRPGWDYYPYVCPANGQTGWSGRQGQSTWYYVGDTPDCVTYRNLATDWGIPSDCQYVRYLFEIYADCNAFGIPSTECTGQTNFTPIVDNVRVRMTHRALAPYITFDVGAKFQDGFPTQDVLETNGTGNANIVRDLNMGDESRPDKLGDSICVTGPAANPQGTDRWESRLYFRVRREGPAQRSIPRYNTWLQRVSDGLDIVGAHAPFAFGWMDSVELSLTQKNRFCSQFRENDDDYIAPEQGEDNEIIWDGIFTPGTKIEYFVTANYICTPQEQFLLPDTAGGHWSQFEILPGYRWAAPNVARFPCILYVMGGSEERSAVETALQGVLAGLPPDAPRPDPAPWDRYDFGGSCSCWAAPLFRGMAGSNNGATLAQLMGYRVILVTTGGSTAGTMEPRDWSGFASWLQYTDCAANGTLQGLILNGDNMGEILQLDGTSFLNNFLGARLVCNDYNAPGCPPGETENDQNQCVRLEYAPGGPWAPAIPADVFANWCPSKLSYDVLQTFGTGVGNKVYSKVGTGVAAEYAEITNDQRSPGNASNYRSVVSGFSYQHIAARDLGHPGPESECPNDQASIIAAATSELREAIRWTLNISNPLDLGLCLDPCVPQEPNEVVEGAAAGPVNRLEQNRPNPFNPRTSIRYAVAQSGMVKLVIYDVNGRLVKSLVHGAQAAGSHEAIWDGTDDAGHEVGSGIYWSQLSVGDYSSQKKMMILK